MPVTVLVFFLLGYALPLIVISALYVLIARHVRRHRRRLARPAASRHTADAAREALAIRGTGHGSARTLRLIVTVVVVFGISWLPIRHHYIPSSLLPSLPLLLQSGVLCWLPIHVQSVAGYFGFHSPDGAVYEVFRVVWNCMAYSNSCANPFIYHCRPSTVPRRGRLAQRQRQRQRPGCPVIPRCCCQSTPSFTSTAGTERRLPLSQRTKSTYIRQTPDIIRQL